MQPWPDNVKHSAASLPGSVGAIRGVGERIGNVACCDIPHARGGVLLDRFLHQRRRMAQRAWPSVQRQFYQKRHLAQHWVRDAGLVEWLRRNS